MQAMKDRNSFHIRKIIPQVEEGWNGIRKSQQALWDRNIDLIKQYTYLNGEKTERELTSFLIVHPNLAPGPPMRVDLHELCGITTEDGYQLMFLVPEDRTAGAGTDVTMVDSRVLIIHAQSGRVAYTPSMIPIYKHTIPVMKWLAENEEWGYEGCEIPWVGPEADWPEEEEYGAGEEDESNLAPA